jgi:hypothetical protein
MTTSTVGSVRAAGKHFGERTWAQVDCPKGQRVDASEPDSIRTAEPRAKLAEVGFDARQASDLTTLAILFVGHCDPGADDEGCV